MNTQTEQEALNIFELIEILRDNFKIIAYTIAAGILFGLYLSFSSPNVYRAQVLMVEAEQIGGSGGGGSYYENAAGEIIRGERDDKKQEDRHTGYDGQAVL